MMTMDDDKATETSVLETLLSGLDALESARRSGSHMLVYLADMLVQRAREELGDQGPTSSPSEHRALG
jgi:hypothetical protein